jgi:hypothetical protein
MDLLQIFMFHAAFAEALSDDARTELIDYVCRRVAALAAGALTAPPPATDAVAPGLDALQRRYTDLRSDALRAAVALGETPDAAAASLRARPPAALVAARDALAAAVREGLRAAMQKHMRAAGIPVPAAAATAPAAVAPAPVAADAVDSAVVAAITDAKKVGFLGATACVSVLRWFTNHLSRLPHAAASRLVGTHDAAALLTRLQEADPWARNTVREPSLGDIARAAEAYGRTCEFPTHCYA